MSEAINCPSCGGSNQLPTGKSSMFCAFCGRAIQKANNLHSSQSAVKSILKVKPVISERKTINVKELRHDGFNDSSYYEKVEKVVQHEGILSLIDRDIESLYDIINWFSDNELNEIRVLHLPNNKISNLDGIQRFSSLVALDLSNNNITSLEIPSLNSHSPILIDYLYLAKNKISSLKGISNFSCLKLDISKNELRIFDHIPNRVNEDFQLNLEDNPYLTSFTEDVKTIISKMADNGRNRFTVALSGCQNFDYNNIIDIINRNKAVHIWMNIRKGTSLPPILVNIGFEKHPKSEYETRYPKFTEEIHANPPKFKPVNHSNCFIATATMGSYEHPIVIELRNFRDNWILEKRWGNRFVEWYYHYGAIAAKFIEKSYILKKISYLLIVKPLYILSKLITTKY